MGGSDIGLGTVEDCHRRNEGRFCELVVTPGICCIRGVRPFSEVWRCEVVVEVGSEEIEQLVFQDLASSSRTTGDPNTRVAGCRFSLSTNGWDIGT